MSDAIDARVINTDQLVTDLRLHSPEMSIDEAFALAERSAIETAVDMQKAGKSVVIDGTFPDREQWHFALDFFQQSSANVSLYLLQAPWNVLLERAMQRRATTTHHVIRHTESQLRAIVNRANRGHGALPQLVTRLDSTRPVDQLVQAILADISPQCMQYVGKPTA